MVTDHWPHEKKKKKKTSGADTEVGSRRARAAAAAECRTPPAPALEKSAYAESRRRVERCSPLRQTKPESMNASRESVELLNATLAACRTSNIELPPLS